MLYVNLLKWFEIFHCYDFVSSSIIPALFAEFYLYAFEHKTPMSTQCNATQRESTHIERKRWKKKEAANERRRKSGRRQKPIRNDMGGKVNLRVVSSALEFVYTLSEILLRNSAPCTRSSEWIWTRCSSASARTGTFYKRIRQTPSWNNRSNIEQMWAMRMQVIVAILSSSLESRRHKWAVAQGTHDNYGLWSSGELYDGYSWRGGQGEVEWNPCLRQIRAAVHSM